MYTHDLYFSSRTLNLGEGKAEIEGYSSSVSHGLF